MNGTTSRGVFSSIAKAQAADLRGGVVIWIANGGSYDIKQNTAGASFILNNGNGAFLRSEGALSPGNNPANIEWDFEVVFNDGVELRSGYGARNSNGNKSVDFSRASDSGCENKSGIVELISADNPCISDSGLSVYGSYINYFSNPQSPSTQSITIPSGTYTLWIIGAGSATTIYGTVTEDNEVTFTTTGESITVTVAGNVELCNLINLNKIAPPILNNAAPSARSTDVSSIMIENNLPKNSSPFTILADFIGVNDGSDHRVVSNLNDIYLRSFGSNAFINFGIKTKEGDRQIVSNFSVESGFKYRAIVVVNPGYKSEIYMNSVMVGSTNTIASTDIDFTKNLYIGSYNGSIFNINSNIKSIKIAHTALTYDQVQSLGVYN